MDGKCEVEGVPVVVSGNRRRRLFHQMDDVKGGVLVMVVNCCCCCCCCCDCDYECVYGYGYDYDCYCYHVDYEIIPNTPTQ